MATKRSSGHMTRKIGQRKWRIKEQARNIHVITIDFQRVGEEQRVLLQSDVHWDNPKCNQELFMSHLDQAREYDAPIVDIGDFNCAMQGKWDKRANKNDLRPEHQRADYLDALVTTGAEMFKPYRDLLAVRGEGNHETGVRKNHETCLVERLVERIKAYGDSPVCKGGYSGYIVFVAQVAGGYRKPFKMHYHHGHGGGGPVTRGVIQSNRHAVYLADADIVHTGHTHDWWLVPIARVKLNQDNTKVEHSNQYHLSTPGYKDEYADGYGGWHIERGGPPKPIGAAWLTFKYVDQKQSKVNVTFDITEAK